MSISSFDGVCCTGLVWTFKLLPSKNTKTSIRHARYFPCAF